MRLKSALDYLTKQQRPADESSKSLQAWHGHVDSLQFLTASTSDDVPIYIGGVSFFLYSLVVPLERLANDFVKDLLGWNFSPCSGYGYGWSYADGVPKSHLSEPMVCTGSKILDGSMPIFFLRSFPGAKGDSSYIEIDQRLCHVLGIHWLNDKNAWCRLNELGEIVPIAQCIREGGMSYCTLRREELDFYLFLANACLVRVFDVSRSTNWEIVVHKPLSDDQLTDASKEIYAARAIHGEADKPTASWLRGFQIIRCGKSREEMLLKLEGKEPREYASYIIWDWKHKSEQEWSSDPNLHGNYFVESDLPFGTSPAFFKPEVLLQYRQDPSRYTIKERHIECRGAWSLQYDINEEGQVHVYIYHLSRLPYQEQLHWKAFNERPKAGLSARAIKTDFEAQWDLSYNPLLSLKAVLEKFPQEDRSKKSSSVWRMPKIPDTRDLAFLGYVVTDSRKEWEDQVLALAQILVDGLNTGCINKLAEAKGCRDPKLASGKQLAGLLEAGGLPNEEVRGITSPLAELWDLRSSIAHPGGSRPSTDLRKHFRELLERCDRAMRRLAELVDAGFFANTNRYQVLTSDILRSPTPSAQSRSED
ncbi:MAG: hypothetical protein WA117_11605 [Verrucomicrobiia bacterium]